MPWCELTDNTVTMGPTNTVCLRTGLLSLLITVSLSHGINHRNDHHLLVGRVLLQLPGHSPAAAQVEGLHLEVHLARAVVLDLLLRRCICDIPGGDDPSSANVPYPMHYRTL